MKKIILTITICIMLFPVITHAISDKYKTREHTKTWTNCTTTNCVPDTNQDLAIMLANDLKSKINAHAADASEHVVTAITIDDCVNNNFGVTSHTYVAGSALLVGTAAECGLTIGETVYVASVVGVNDITLTREIGSGLLIKGDGDTSISADLARITDNINFPLTSIDAGEKTTDQLFTLIGEMLIDYDAHDGDAELATPLFHVAQEGGDASLSSTAKPITIAEAITRIDDIKAKFNTHDADSTAHTTGSLHLESITDYPVDVAHAKVLDVQCDSLTDTNHTTTDWDWKILTSNVNTGTTASFDTAGTPYYEDSTNIADTIKTEPMTPSNNYWTMRIDENSTGRADVTCTIIIKE